jgi:hypothetical protein
MTTFNSSFAASVIKAALEANSIKLMGSSGNAETAASNAKADATYLLTLFSELTKQTPAD